MNEFSVRVTSYEDSTLLNICDLDLLGKTMKQGKLSVNVGSYYQDQIVGEEKARKLLTDSHIINMVGKNVVTMSLELKVGIESGVKRIDDVPFLLVFKT